MTERTAQDYVIEHAGYMATDARNMIKAVDALAAAELNREESDSDDSHDAVAVARDGVSEARSTLQSGIYEFEKRRDRAAATQGATTPAQPLADDQIFATLAMFANMRGDLASREFVVAGRALLAAALAPQGVPEHE